MPSNIQLEIQASFAAKPKGYRARTKHFVDGKPKYTNRLIRETSPYLIQHAHNPVNWYAWGDEAFEAARDSQKPVFLSIGYSTCHWCHVMEEESFEDEEIAKYLNDHYIAIKVDREERPDVDAVYMAAVQNLTGRGGWPMSVWLTHDKKPFHGGTYFPARDGDRGSRFGFLTILEALKKNWDENPEKIQKGSVQLAEVIKQDLGSRPSVTEVPGREVIQKAVGHYKSRFDSEDGGMQGSPKFPSSLPNRLLLRNFASPVSERVGDPQDRRGEGVTSALFTLKRMALGGMYDQVGGGFHRYSVDEKWLVPHFEKMLYDNALLIPAYLEAWQISKDPFYKHIAEDILKYIQRDMTDVGTSAFYSATDADSLNLAGHREEGFYFTFTPAELISILGEADAGWTSKYFDVTPKGNFEGRSILHLKDPLTEKDRIKWQSVREKLLEARNKRPLPIRDDKILTSWNGLMIGAFAKGSIVLQEKKWKIYAERAADFIHRKMYRDGRLFRTYKDGQAKIGGYLDDYAFMIQGLLDLFEATQKEEWLKWALELDATLASKFEDPAGGFFMTASDGETLIAREKPGYDGAEPSGNSIHALNLMRLYTLTTTDEYRKRAEKILKAFGSTLAARPTSLSEMLMALDYFHSTPQEIVLVGSDEKSIKPFMEFLSQEFVPNKAVVFSLLPFEGEGRTHGNADGERELLDASKSNRLIPYTAGKIMQKNKPTAYVCEGGVCKRPVTDVETFKKLLPFPG